MRYSSHAARERRRLEQGPVEVWTGRLEEEPAVHAWQELCAGPCPTRLELLRKTAALAQSPEERGKAMGAFFASMVQLSAIIAGVLIDATMG